MSAMGVVPIRPSPQKLTTAACVVLTTSPVQVTTATLKPQPAPMTGVRRPVELARAPRNNIINNQRRVGYQTYIPPPQPTNVLRRNARERNRVKQVNHGFVALRNHIPSAAKNKKLSKVDTLRRAVEYIQNLQALIDESDLAAASPPQASPQLTSPPLPSPQLQTLTPASTCSVDSGYVAHGNTALYLTSPASTAMPHPARASYLSPPASDASSPAPSYASDSTPHAFDAPAYEHAGYDGLERHASVGFEETPYAEPENISAEDEELLDAIAWWQSSQ